MSMAFVFQIGGSGRPSFRRFGADSSGHGGPLLRPLGGYIDVDKVLLDNWMGNVWGFFLTCVNIFTSLRS